MIDYKESSMAGILGCWHQILCRVLIYCHTHFMLLFNKPGEHRTYFSLISGNSKLCLCALRQPGISFNISLRIHLRLKPQRKAPLSQEQSSRHFGSIGVLYRGLNVVGVNLHFLSQLQDLVGCEYVIYGWLTTSEATLTRSTQFFQE